MAENTWITGEISASKWICGTLLKNPVGGPPWRNLQVPNPQLQSQISDATGVFIFMNNFNSWMNVGKVHGKHTMMYGAAISGHFFILCMCVLLVCFCSTQDCPRPYQKEYPTTYQKRWASPVISMEIESLKTCVARTPWNGGILSCRNAGCYKVSQPPSADQ